MASVEQSIDSLADLSSSSSAIRNASLRFPEAACACPKLPATHETLPLLSATARYQGPDKTPMLVLTLPAIANLQRGVTFQVDQSVSAPIKMQVLSDCLKEGDVPCRISI